MKRCKRGHELTSDTTYKYPDGRRECQICRKSYGAAYRKDNQERLREQAKSYGSKANAKARKARKADRGDEIRRSDRERYHKNKKVILRRQYGYHIKRTYGLIKEQYETLLESQNNKCKVCGEQKSYKLNVDHCHKTRRIRGLLCSKCNRGLGYFNDSLSKLRAAVEYLESAGTELFVTPESRAGREHGND